MTFLLLHLWWKCENSYLKSFPELDQQVVASSAFGLGVDCPDIARIINWGPPATLEELIQELGRAGRDGSQAEAILYFKKSHMKISAAVQQYGENCLLCRRSSLFSHFLFYEPTMLYLVNAVICVPHCVIVVNVINSNVITQIFVTHVN